MSMTTKAICRNKLYLIYILCCISACSSGSISEEEVDASVRASSSALELYAGTHSGLMITSITLSQVKVDAVYKDAWEIPDDWRPSSEALLALEEAEEFRDQKYYFALVEVAGTCKGRSNITDSREHSKEFKGKVLYNVSKKEAIPMDVRFN